MGAMVDNPHDAFFKLVFSQPEHAAGELRAVLPPELAGRFDWSTLALCPGSFVDEAFAQSHTDLLFSAMLDGCPTLLYFLFEHLSTVQPLVPFRLLRYQVRIWDDWLTAHPKAKKLPPIVPMVLHHSPTGWRGPTRFEELLDADEPTLALLAPFLPHFRFLLDDVSKTTDEALRLRAMTALGKVALWCFRDVRKPGVLLRNLARVLDLLIEVRKAPNGQAAIRAVLRYIVATTRKLHPQEIKDAVRSLSAPIEGTMETLADQLEEMFMEKGIERGRREGIEHGRRDMLLRQLRKRFGELPESAVARVAAAQTATLDTWAERVLTATTLDEVLTEE